MKKIILKSLVFLLPVILIVGLWEYGLSKMQNSYSLKRSQLEEQAPKIQALVLGGSYSLRGVNPDSFSIRGYNLGNIEQSLFYDTRITEKYLDKMTSLKVVLIAVSYASLWYQVSDGQESFRDYFYADYWDIRYPSLKWYDLHIYSKILHYGNDKAWQYALRGFKANLAKGYFDNGWAIKEGGETLINDSVGRVMVLKHAKDFKDVNLTSNINDLNTFLKELEKRKICPVFFTPPTTSSNYKYMEPGRLKIMDSVITALCNTYHCKWHNYYNDPRFSNEDFKDYAHLNRFGAAKFSRIINEEIIKNYSVLQTN